MVFLLALFLVFVIPALLLYGVCFVVMMCWRGSALGFVLLSSLVLLVVGFFVVRRNLREREFRSLLSRGVDFGLKEESLQAVDGIVVKYGKRCRRVSALKAEVAPMVETLARRYNSMICVRALQLATKVVQMIGFMELPMKTNLAIWSNARLQMKQYTTSSMNGCVRQFPMQATSTTT